MGWTTAYVVAGDGEDPEECATAIEAIIRTGARPDAEVIRVERGRQFETRQTVWPAIGPEFTCRRDIQRSQTPATFGWQTSDRP